MKLWWNENSNVSHLLLLLLPNINRTLVPLKSAAEGKNNKKHCNFFLERKMPLNETKELAQIVDETILPMGTQRRGWLDDSARGIPCR